MDQILDFEKRMASFVPHRRHYDRVSPRYRRRQQEDAQRRFSMNTNVQEVMTDDTRPVVVQKTVSPDPIRMAFYNVTMALFALCCGLALIGSYFLFYDFVKPVLWATICGIVLFPLKRLMTSVVQNWFDRISDSGAPFIGALCLAPLELLDHLGEHMLALLTFHWHLVLIAAGSMPMFSLLLQYQLLPLAIVYARLFFTKCDQLLSYFTSFLAVLPLAVYLTIILIGCLFPGLRKWLSGVWNIIRHESLGPILWLLALSHFCTYFGPVKSGFFICTLIIYCWYYGRKLARTAGPLLHFNGWHDGIKPIASRGVRRALSIMVKVNNHWDTRVLTGIQAQLTQIQDQRFSVSGDASDLSSTVAQVDDKLLANGHSLTNHIDNEDNGLRRRKGTLTRDSSALGDSIDSQDGPLGSEGGHFLSSTPKAGSSHSGNEIDHEIASGEEEEVEDADFHLRWLLITCSVVYVSTRLWMVSVLAIPVFLTLLKRITLALGVDTIFLKTWHVLQSRCRSQVNVLFPGPLRTIVAQFLHIDKQIVGVMRQSMDMVGSLAALLILLLLIVCLSLFVVFQLYYESVHMIMLASTVASEMMARSEQFRNWVLSYTGGNASSVQQLVQTQSERLYQQYGQTWISAQITELMDGNETQAAILEAKATTMLQALYQSLYAEPVNQSDLSGLDSDTEVDVWTPILSSLSTLDFQGSLQGLMDLIYDNLKTVLEILNSVWTLVLENMNLVLGSVGGVLTTILASGSAALDFVLDLIVFLTILLGLLSSSGTQFKPLEVLQYLSPSQASAAEICRNIEEAVSGIFLATLKMAIFYGMFTWLTHTLFAVNLIFIPSVLAALFAAIPFFGTTLVTAPAILELWLVRGEPFLAFLLFIIHSIPGYFVDDSIYAGIKLCDPFVTGMSIAGGMLWWGLEGAIFGPILLCIYLVILNVYTNIIAVQMKSDDECSDNVSEKNV